jgi:hypothetical protein
MSEILWKNFRHGGYSGGVDVVGFFEAPSGSVLAGQTLKQFLGNYPNEEAAREAHPDVEGWSSKWTDPQVSVAHLPGEDDPVPGGMYLDDIDDGY